jgi:electron transfer flavoprotein alpha subunit
VNNRRNFNKMPYGEVWTLSECGQQTGTTPGLLRVSYELLTRGRELADKLETNLCSVVLCGNDLMVENDLQQLIKRGADKVYVVQAPQLEHFITETYSNVIMDLVSRFKPEIFIAAATSMGRTLMPHISARLHTGLTADCTGLDIEPLTGNLLQTRPAIGGNIMATIKTPSHRPQMATVRTRSTNPAPIDEMRKGEVVRIDFNPELEDKRVSRIGFRKIDESSADIQSVEVVVAGGKGLKNKGSFSSIIGSLANTISGALSLPSAVGASRDAVDRGWASYPHQVGLSGKTVAPKLYVAVGISGSVQHLAGMKTSENIVAINNDPEAQIFKTADFGIVGDLFDVIPVLIEKLDKSQE